MGDVSCFWMNAEFSDAKLLLSSDAVLLELSRKALHDTLNTAAATTKKRKPPAAKTPAKSPGAKPRASSTSETDAAAQPASAAIPEATRVLTIPVHRIVLSTGSDYFKTAISTLIGDSAGLDLARPFHPIIVAHEQDVEAAQRVLQFLYTKVLEAGIDCRQLMHMLMVSPATL